MRMDVHEVADVVVIAVAGEVSVNKGGEVALGDKVRSLVHEGHRKLVIDLTHVSYMDSAGLGQLVQAHSTCARLGASLRLSGLTARMKDLLTITKLLLVFDTYPVEAEAIASFATAR